MWKRTLSPEAYQRKLQANARRRKERVAADPDFAAQLSRKAAARYARMTPEARRERNRREYAAIRANPEAAARKLRTNRAWKGTDAGRLAAQRDVENRRGTRAAPPAPFCGSVLAASAASPWRDILARLTSIAPRVEDRDEVVAEAAFLVLQGEEEGAAIRRALQSVLREAAPYRYAKPIHECFFL